MTPIILADDLSGAMEVAAVFHRHRWRPRIPFATAIESNAAPGAINVISTETRNERPAAARQTLAALLATFPSANAGLLFKKIDSTMRGPVGAELAALRDAHPGRPVFITPANPVAGRVVRNGILYLDGAPITRSPFRNDPVCPVCHDDIATLILANGGETLAPALAALPLVTLREDTTGCAAFIRENTNAGRTLFACDAETAADLDALVQAAHLAHEQPILVGSGALAASLAATMPGTASDPGIPRIPHSPVLFACGSMHPLSRRQMQQLNLPLHTLHFDCNAAHSVVQNITNELARIGSAAFVLEPDQPVTAAHWLEVTTRTVAAIHSRQRIGALFVTGGETARSVCQRLGGSALELLGEIEQGVAAARLDTATGPILVITKPGGFGDDRTLVRVQQWLAKN